MSVRLLALATNSASGISGTTVIRRAAKEVDPRALLPAGVKARPPVLKERLPVLVPAGLQESQQLLAVNAFREMVGLQQLLGRIAVADSPEAPLNPT